MKELYKNVLLALQEENKETAVRLSIDALEEGKVNVAELYEMILVPALNHIIEEYTEEEELIWREHVRSGIVRTIIESAYPYILAEKNKIIKDKGKVIVMCPANEEHELGARMVSDFFTLSGFDSTFVGARTPLNTVLKAIEVVKPKYICISVTNYYNLVSVKETISTIKDQNDSDIGFIVGGRAFAASPDAFNSIGADILTQNFDDVKNLDKEVQ